MPPSLEETSTTTASGRERLFLDGTQDPQTSDRARAARPKFREIFGFGAGTHLAQANEWGVAGKFRPRETGQILPDAAILRSLNHDFLLFQSIDDWWQRAGRRVGDQHPTAAGQNRNQIGRPEYHLRLNVRNGRGVERGFRPIQAE